ncbi:MAG: squalene/oxidosqualene cyclase [Phycisphaerales bacterium]|nr:squalene/oxidosqualene cyclase [Phycisphaerales bacterium]MDB5357432.1 squalene/oxidosqualene cyclase [Phycisphaerales bacterium]
MTRPHRSLVIAALAAAITLSPAAMLMAAPEAPPPAASGATQKDASAIVDKEIEKGLEYLKTQQKPDGTWQGVGDPPAITAIVLHAFTQDPKYGANQDFIKKGFANLLSHQKEDGSISSDFLATYNTAIATSALASANSPEYKAAVDKAVAYLRSLEWTDKIEGVPNQTLKVDPKDPRYGGWGYGTHGKPDLSNAQTALDALHDAGLKPGDPAYDAALKFITRAQNNSETNDQKWAGDDGSFVYSPADGGESKAGEYTGPDGRRMLRGYGSMTYAGLKSMIYAGLTKDDARVKAAWAWIRKNWTLDQNPGIQFANPKDPKAADYGLFYYYHTLARALRAYGEPVITDAKGGKHDWRVELIEKLARDQAPDGSWVGTQKWMENKPILSTAYAVLALQEAQQDLKAHPPQMAK